MAVVEHGRRAKDETTASATLEHVSVSPRNRMPMTL